MRSLAPNALRAVVPLALLLSSACDQTGPRLVPTTVQLSETSVALPDGDSVRLVARVMDQHGAPLEQLPRGVTLTWSSSAPGVASVADGLVRAMRPGTARISAQAGPAVGTAEVAVRAVPTGVQTVAGTGQQGTVARSLADSLAVRVTDRHGDGVAGVTVVFAVTSGGGAVSAPTATTGADGRARALWTLGAKAGEQSVTAEVQYLPPVVFRATAVAGAPAEVRRESGDGQSGGTGGELPDPLVVRVLDAHGNPAAGVEVAWAVTGGGGSVSPARVATDTTGRARTTWTLGNQTGPQTATATISGLPAATFTASAGAAAGPVITSVSPALLTPGATATLSGRDFGSTAGENTVTIAGASAQVLEATPTRLTVRVPGRDALPCQPTGDAAVVVRVSGASGSRQHPLQVASEVQLTVGQTVNVESRDVRCTALPQSGGRFVISVYNTSASLGNLTALQLRSVGTPAASAPAVVRTPVAAAPLPAGLLGGHDDAAHTAMLEENLELTRRLAARMDRSQGIRRSLAAASVPQVGDTLSLRVPKRGTSSLCANFTEVRARAVYSGPRAVILEDVAAPLAGQMDSTYRMLGREYEASMHEVVASNFGDPLVLDGRLDNNGRILMLFSKLVADDAPGAFAFVFGGDLFDRSQCASSNQAEIFYGQVPTVSGTGFSGNTAESWLRSMRSTMIHEVKHISSLAARVANNATTWETSWLEESTARIAEELWARRWFGYAHRGNVDYQRSIYCEVRPTWTECAGTPRVMIKHFSALYQFLRSGGRLSPLGSADGSESSFYGSGWSLVRWAIDQSPDTESAFLRALTQERSRAGASNLEARTGRSFADLLADWSLALALDNRPGFTPSRPALSFPSWATRDIYQGLNRDFPSSYTAAFAPLVVPLTYSGFTADIPELRGGSVALFELSGTPAVPPVMELRSASGAAPASTVRMAIVRVQ